LVSKSVTLNDLERRNGRFLRYFCDDDDDDDDDKLQPTKPL